MKKTLLFLISILVSFVAFSQDYTEIKSSRDTTKRHGEHEIGWMKSHMADNWFIGLQGGGQLYYGYEDRKGPLFDRITADANGYIGRWIFPMVGIRAFAGAGYARGFITKPTYLNNRNSYTGNGGYGTCWGRSTDVLISGNDTIYGSLGGYLFPVDDDDNLFVQKWKYVYAGGDLIVNLSYMKRYSNIDFAARWNHMVYTGFSIHVGLSEEHPEITIRNTNFAAEGHVGYIGRYMLTENLNFTTDVRLSVVEGLFDRERLPNVEPLMQDLMFNVQFGLAYDFNFRSNRERLRYYVEKGILPQNATSVPKYMSYVQLEEVNYIKIIDTLYTHRFDTVVDIRHQYIRDSLIQVIDSIKNVMDSLPEATPLDSIFIKQLLPYEMVFFDLDKWNIRPEEDLKIAKMARIMKAYPDTKFILTGSADSKTGTVNRNRLLSINRANVVFNRLVYEYGIPESQLIQEHLGGILDYDPFELNRTTVIIMDHPAVRRAFEEMKAQRRAGGGVGEVN